MLNVALVAFDVLPTVTLKLLEAKRVIDPLIRGTVVEFMPEGISDIGDNEDIDSIVKKYRTDTEIGALNYGGTMENKQLAGVVVVMCLMMAVIGVLAELYARAIDKVRIYERVLVS